MNLWIDSRMLSCSGIGTVIKNLIPSLSEVYQTTLIAHPKDIEKLSSYTLKQCDASIYSVREQLVLPSLIRNCDLFWSPHYNVPILPIDAKKRIVTIHDACHLAFRNSLGWKEKIYAKFMMQQAITRSDIVLTDSKFSQEELCKYLSVPLEKIRVIYPGVDFKRFSLPSSSEMKEHLRKKYSLPSAFFLFVGNVKPHKNLRLILECYERFSVDIPIVIIGKKTGFLQSDSSIQMISESLKKKIFFTGEVLDEEIPIFYQMAIALIFPSLYEGFGLPPLEAMAAGCPAIVSNRACMPEVCGNAAYFIDPTKADELYEAMSKVSSSSRESLIQRGKERALSFSWTNTATQYIQALGSFV